MRSNKIPFLSRLVGADTGRGDYNRFNTSNSPGGRKFNWKRFGIGAIVVLVIIIVLGPRHRRDSVFGMPKGLSKQSSSNFPTSPETDPDPLKTVHCTKPYDSTKPLVQYSLMIDAGSTGSRIHVYKFHNCLAHPRYEYEVFQMIRPGLSSYNDPLSAAESLDQLLDVAVATVPKSLQSCTPIAVKATAGLRLGGHDAAQRILDAVRYRLTTRYPFPVAEEEGVVIMDGKEEGVYAWITANYLLESLSAVSTPGISTYAVLDLGGGSTQIVFEPTSKIGDLTPFAEGDHKYALNFADRNHTLYQHSYLGYGLMSARKNIHRLAIFMSTFNLVGEESPISIAQPCISRGQSRTVEVEGRNISMIGADVGSFDGCKRLVELVMAKDAICQVKPCSFGGVYQPSLLDSFPTGKVLLLSYFYDRISPLLSNVHQGHLTEIKILKIAELARKVCLGPDEWHRSFATNKQAMEELEGRPEYCLDLTFMYTLLRLGYEFEDDRIVNIAKQVESTELGWALGAGIALVGARLECKV